MCEFKFKKNIFHAIKRILYKYDVCMCVYDTGFLLWTKFLMIFNVFTNIRPSFSNRLADADNRRLFLFFVVQSNDEEFTIWIKCTDDSQNNVDVFRINIQRRQICWLSLCSLGDRHYSTKTILLVYIAHIGIPRVFIVIIGVWGGGWRINVISTRFVLGLCRPSNFF